jgi:hypothetical protein
MYEERNWQKQRNERAGTGRKKGRNHKPIGKIKIRTFN